MKNKIIIISVVMVVIVVLISRGHWRVERDKMLLRKCFVGGLSISDLSESSLSRSEPALIELLNDTNLTVKVSAIRVLGEMGSIASQKHIIKLMGSNSSQIRFFAVEALGLIGESFPENKIIEILRTDPSRQVRYQAATSLARSGGDVTRKYFESVYSSNDSSIEDEMYSSIILYTLTREQRYHDRVVLLLQDQDVDLGVKMCGTIVLRQIDDGSFRDLYDRETGQPFDIGVEENLTTNPPSRGAEGGRSAEEGNP